VRPYTIWPIRLPATASTASAPPPPPAKQPQAVAAPKAERSWEATYPCSRPRPWVRGPVERSTVSKSGVYIARYWIAGAVAGRSPGHGPKASGPRSITQWHLSHLLSCSYLSLSPVTCATRTKSPSAPTTHAPGASPVEYRPTGKGGYCWSSHRYSTGLHRSTLLPSIARYWLAGSWLGQTCYTVAFAPACEGPLAAWSRSIKSRHIHHLLA